MFPLSDVEVRLVVEGLQAICPSDEAPCGDCPACVLADHVRNLQAIQNQPYKAPAAPDRSEVDL